MELAIAINSFLAGGIVVGLLTMLWRIGWKGVAYRQR
jgi:hypothetical protein